MRKNLLLIVAGILLPIFSLQANDKQLGKLAKLLDKDKVDQCLSKSLKLSKQPDYRKNPGPHYYITLSYVKISEGVQKYQISNYLEKSVKAFHKFEELGGSKQNYDLTPIREAYASHADFLFESRNKKKAKFFYQILAEQFMDTLDNYRDLCSLEKYKRAEAEPEAIETLESKPEVSNLSLRDSLLDFAATMLGTRYKYGSKTKTGTDCSGFTGQVYEEFKMSLPRTSRSQATLGEKVAMKDAKKGDLVFFGSKRNGEYRINHVAMVSSDPGEPLEVIHATTSKGVMYNVIEDSEYWEKKMLFVKNVLDSDQVSQK